MLGEAQAAPGRTRHSSAHRGRQRQRCPGATRILRQWLGLGQGREGERVAHPGERTKFGRVKRSKGLTTEQRRVGSQGVQKLERGLAFFLSRRAVAACPAVAACAAVRCARWHPMPSPAGVVSSCTFAHRRLVWLYTATCDKAKACALVFRPFGMVDIKRRVAAVRQSQSQRLLA